MAPEVEYRDKVKLFRTVKNGYGMDSLPDPEHYEEMCGLYVQVTNFNHNDNTDGISVEHILHLPPDNEFLQENGYRIEQMVVSISPFGTKEQYQMFRIASVNVARDVLIGNEVHNIECALTKIAGVVNDVSED